MRFVASVTETMFFFIPIWFFGIVKTWISVHYKLGVSNWSAFLLLSMTSFFLLFMQKAEMRIYFKDFTIFLQNKKK